MGTDKYVPKRSKCTEITIHVGKKSSHTHTHTEVQLSRGPQREQYMPSCLSDCSEEDSSDREGNHAE